MHIEDINDLYLFARVVEAGGFAAAERDTGIPKSRLSRRIAGLEKQLGVRLRHRSTPKLGFASLVLDGNVQHHVRAYRKTRISRTDSCSNIPSASYWSAAFL